MRFLLDLACDLAEALFVLESPVVKHLANGAGTLDLVRAALAKVEAAP